MKWDGDPPGTPVTEYKIVFAAGISTINMDPNLVNALIVFANARKKDVVLNSGWRDSVKQQQLWDLCLAPLPGGRGGHINNAPNCPTLKGKGDGNTAHAKGTDGVECSYKVAKPGLSKHEQGKAADLNGLSKADCQYLNMAGLGHTVTGEIWHVELTSTSKCTANPHP